MGIFGRDDNPAPPTTPTESRASNSNPPIAAGDRTIVARPTTIEGKIVGASEVLIDGTVKGSIMCDALVRIAEKGSITADVHARSIQVAGVVKGDLTADERIVLEDTARVIGNLTAPRVLIQDGASFKGRVKMRSGAPQNAGENTPVSVGRDTTP